MFKVYNAQPFDKPKINQLIKAVNYDISIRNKFLSEIVDKRFDDYESFLKTPLLALMMLMTFSQCGEVPDKRSVFYKYVFMTLYSWHDGSKEAFKRESKTGLDVDQFEKLFSIFCLLTYVDFKFQIDRHNFLKILDKCKKYVEFDFDRNLFIKEVVESVNLIYKEGDLYIFTHRTFQEYFTAFACVNFFQSKLLPLSDRMNRNSDSVLALMRDINDDVVDEYLVCPEAEKCLPYLNELVKLSEPRKILAEMESELVVEFYVGRNGSLNNRIDFTRLKNEQWQKWMKIIRLEATSIPNNQFEEVYLPSHPTRLTTEILKKIKDSISLENENSYVFTFLIGLNEIKVYQNKDIDSFILTLDDDTFNEDQLIYKTDNLELKAGKWINSLSEFIMKKAQFTKLRMEEARSRVSTKGESIDDILSD